MADVAIVRVGGAAEGSVRAKARGGTRVKESLGKRMRYDGVWGRHGAEKRGRNGQNQAQNKIKKNQARVKNTVDLDKVERDLKAIFSHGIADTKKKEERVDLT